MRPGQVLIFWALTFTTLFGGLIYLGYLGIVYRMDRADPVVGQQIRAREVAIAADKQATFELLLRIAKSPIFWGPIVGFLIVRAIMGGGQNSYSSASVRYADVGKGECIITFMGEYHYCDEIGNDKGKFAATLQRAACWNAEHEMGMRLGQTKLIHDIVLPSCADVQISKDDNDNWQVSSDAPAQWTVKLRRCSDVDWCYKSVVMNGQSLENQEAYKAVAPLFR